MAIVISLATMLGASQVNLFGIVILLIGVYFFSVKYNVGNGVVKVLIALIVYILIVTIISFLSTMKNILPDFGLYVLQSDLDLETNNVDLNPVTNTLNTITTVSSDQIKQPEFYKYTYAFSVYSKGGGNNLDYSSRYLFCRKDDACPSSPTLANHGRNIGLRLDTNQKLHLDYATTSDGNTTFKTVPVQTTIFPPNQWTKIVVTVDKTVINVYIDETIVTKQIGDKNLKQPSARTPIEFGNMPAHLANFSHSSSVIPPTPSFIQYLSKTDGIVVA